MLKHCFAICAHGESPYLEDCILSLIHQNLPTGVLICTSTPNEYICTLAGHYGLRLFVREGESSLGADWNFALETAAKEARLVTLAHQDDIYDGNYTRALAKAYAKYPDMSLFCTGFRVIDAEGKLMKAGYEGVKRRLRSLLRLKKIADKSFIKRSALIFGNAICCPSCTYNLDMISLPLFDPDETFVTDWLALLSLAQSDGRFICNERALIDYRIHSGAATASSMKNHVREVEEYEVLRSIWPRPVAFFWSRLLRLSYSPYKEDRKAHQA